MASVNKVILLGNLGQDPDVRYSADGGRAIASFSVATTRRYRNAEQQIVSETEWHRVVFFSRLAEIARDYLRKGSPLYLEGRLRTRKWTDQNGQDRYTTEIVGEVLQLLGSRQNSDGQQGGYAGQGGGFESQPRQQPRRQEQAPRPAPRQPAAPAPAATSASIDTIEEDVPF